MSESRWVAVRERLPDLFGENPVWSNAVWVSWTGLKNRVARGRCGRGGIWYDDQDGMRFNSQPDVWQPILIPSPPGSQPEAGPSDGEKRIQELETLLAECADEIEAEVKARYEPNDEGVVHPALKRRYRRDMDIVIRARAAMTAAQPEGSEKA